MKFLELQKESLVDLIYWHLSHMAMQKDSTDEMGSREIQKWNRGGYNAR